VSQLACAAHSSAYSSTRQRTCPLTAVRSSRRRRERAGRGWESGPWWAWFVGSYSMRGACSRWAFRMNGLSLSPQRPPRSVVGVRAGGNSSPFLEVRGLGACDGFLGVRLAVASMVQYFPSWFDLKPVAMKSATVTLSSLPLS